MLCHVSPVGICLFTRWFTAKFSFRREDREKKNAPAFGCGCICPVEGVFVKSLQSQIVKQAASGQIEVVTEGPVDAFVKVPPAHLMEDRAARTIKAWLRHCGESSDDASAAKSLPKGKPRA